MIKKIAAVMFVGMFSAQVFAASAGGSNSCGLGWAVTQKKSLLATSTRETTHYFLPPTFSMTTGTSECDKHSIAQNETPAVEFIASNYEPLIIEVAEGHGEYLHGLARVMGCPDSAYPQFVETTRGNFDEVVGSSKGTPVDAYLRVKNVVKKNSGLAAQCTTI